jgi:GT2 family glycosyltransferase
MAHACISVVVGTRNRSGDIGRAVHSILQSEPAEVIVVDQSDDGRTRDVLSALVAAGRVQLLTDAQRGLARARNKVIAQATGAIIAMVDDDCEVAPDWLTHVERAFASDPAVGMLFGCVRAAPYDRQAGFVPAYDVPQTVTKRGLAAKAEIEGIGACMAVRRTVWEALGGFDDLLGAGAPYQAGEDTDFAVRTLFRGHAVCECREVSVTHHGFRSWAEAPELIAAYMFGLGAVNAKMMRLGKAHAVRPILALAWRWVAGRPVVDLNHLPPRLQRLVAFLGGMRAGFTTRIDSQTGRFIAPS